ncbi:putative holin-like toxin [Abiotrophia defectiva]
MVRLILEFGTFVIALIGLCHKLFNKHDKKIAVPNLTRGTAISSQNRITVLYGSAWESRANSTPSMFIILYRFGRSQISLSGKKESVLITT